MGEALIVRRGGGGGGLENLKVIQPADINHKNTTENRTFIIFYTWWWTDEEDSEVYEGMALIRNKEIIFQVSDMSYGDYEDSVYITITDHYISADAGYSNNEVVDYHTVELTL